MPAWKKVIVSGSDAALNSLNVTSHFTASGLIYPAADNGEESFIQTDGNGNLSLQYVKTIYEEVVNGEATSIVKGTPVYVSGSVGAAAKVFRADAGNASKMPVIYVVADTIAAAATGRGIALGLIAGVDTTGYPAGTEIYVAVGGGWTSTRPTGTAIVQTLGYVTKEGAGGMGVILNPGPNNLPNLPAGNVWVGNSNALPVATATSSIQNVVSASFATTAGSATNVTGTVAVANGGTGQTTYTNGQLLIGNTTGNTLTKATLTAGSGITITNGNGSISIAATGGGGGIGGSGTTNRIAKFTGTTTVGTSSIDDDGTTITSLVSHTFNSSIFTDTETFTVRSGVYVFGGDFDMSSQYGDYVVRGGVTSNTNYDNIVNTWGSDLLCNGQILNDCISGEALSAGELVYMRNSGVWLKADATQLDRSTTLLGIALKNVDSDEQVSILLDGIIHTSYHAQAAIATPGLPLYIDTTPGQVTETAPSTAGEFVRVVGHNIHDNSSGVVAIRFKPDNTWIEL
jgi:hypothetical protein